MNLNKFSIGDSLIHDETKNKGELRNLFSSVKDNEPLSDKLSNLSHFLLNLAICNTINPEIDIETNELFYDGSSIDEIALVKATRDNGFALKKRNQNSVEIDVLGKTKTFEILNTIEFNSDRKKMSTIVKDENGKIICYSKGADNIMEKIVKPDCPNLKFTFDNINTFAMDGLRTLVIAYKDLTEEEYTKWNQNYQDALNSQKGKSKKIADAEAELEKDFIVLGSSAIEDCLQEDVPETIEFFRKAGVQVWILTGDKRDTAVSIAKTSRLLTDKTVQEHIKGSDVVEVSSELQRCIETCKVKKISFNNFIRPRKMFPSFWTQHPLVLQMSI
jgi:phospholipid-transporting ATPase